MKSDFQLSWVSGRTEWHLRPWWEDCTWDPPTHTHTSHTVAVIQDQLPRHDKFPSSLWVNTGSSVTGQQVCPCPSVEYRVSASSLTGINAEWFHMKTSMVCFGKKTVNRSCPSPGPPSCYTHVEMWLLHDPILLSSFYKPYQSLAFPQVPQNISLELQILDPRGGIQK